MKKPEEDRTGQALLQAIEYARDERRKWWPFWPPSWSRRKKPDPKKPAGGVEKEVPKKEPVDA